MSIVCMAEYQFFPMHISRVHIAILGIISVLTGIVAPIVQVDWVYLPLPVTNLRITTLFLLICMMGAFLAAVFQRWKFFNTFALLMTLCIIMTALFTLSGTLGNYRGIGESVTFSWGWIFFLGWITLFFLQQFLESHDETISFGFMWGVGSLFLLTIISIILYISLLNEKNHGDTPLLKDFFSTGTRILSWGIALSPSFLEIRSLSYDRINDVLAFHARDEGGEKIFIGKGSGTVLALSGINDVVFTNYGGNVYYLLSSLREGMSVYREWTRLLSGPLIIPGCPILAMGGYGKIWMEIPGIFLIMEMMIPVLSLRVVILWPSLLVQEISGTYFIIMKIYSCHIRPLLRCTEDIHHGKLSLSSKRETRIWSSRMVKYSIPFIRAFCRVLSFRMGMIFSIRQKNITISKWIGMGRHSHDSTKK